MRQIILSVKSFFVLGALLTCVSIFRFHFRFTSFSRVLRDDDAFKPPFESRMLSNDNDTDEDEDDKFEDNTRRLDISCCGIGHRFDTIAAAVRDLSPVQVAINWGSCENSSNIFGDIFKPDANSTIVPYEPVEDEVPFPEMRSLDDAGIRKGDKSVPEHVQNALVDLLVNSIADDYMEIVDEFKQDVGWDDTLPVIGLHVRTGNTAVQQDTLEWEKESRQMNRRVGGKLQDEIGLENSLRLYMSNVNALAVRMGIAEDYRVLVVTDSDDVIDLLRTMTDIPRWFYRPQRYQDVAHPLVFANLGLNNAGERCQLEWFYEPIVDLHLLASTDAMVTSMKSSFYRIVEMSHLANNRPVCHCSQNFDMPAACQCVGENEILLPEL